MPWENHRHKTDAKRAVVMIGTQLEREVRAVILQGDAGELNERNPGKNKILNNNNYKVLARHLFKDNKTSVSQKSKL